MHTQVHTQQILKYTSLCIRSYVCMHVCMHARMYACAHACMCACMHACMYIHTVQLHSSDMYVYIYTYINAQVHVLTTCEDNAYLCAYAIVPYSPLCICRETILQAHGFLSRVSVLSRLSGLHFATVKINSSSTIIIVIILNFILVLPSSSSSFAARESLVQRTP